MTTITPFATTPSISTHSTVAVPSFAATHSALPAITTPTRRATIGQNGQPMVFDNAQREIDLSGICCLGCRTTRIPM
ncbi:MAG: hypothetical protein AAFX99_32915, partial [Myxococcota bacterium]